MILVDTNVLLDLVTDDPDWSEWSLARLEEAALTGPILINDIVYAEISIRYDRIEDLDSMLDDAMIEIAPTPRPALFLAGKAFQKYRAVGGVRTGRAERHPAGVLVLLDRRRGAAAGLCALYSRSGLHHRPGNGTNGLFAQSLFRVPRAQAPSGKMMPVHVSAAGRGLCEDEQKFN